jgi:hypothetical protein
MMSADACRVCHEFAVFVSRERVGHHTKSETLIVSNTSKHILVVFHLVCQKTSTMCFDVPVKKKSRLVS